MSMSRHNFHPRSPQNHPAPRKPRTETYWQTASAPPSSHWHTPKIHTDKPPTCRIPHAPRSPARRPQMYRPSPARHTPTDKPAPPCDNTEKSMPQTHQHWLSRSPYIAAENPDGPQSDHGTSPGIGMHSKTSSAGSTPCRSHPPPDSPIADRSAY